VLQVMLGFQSIENRFKRFDGLGDYRVGLHVQARYRPYGKDGGESSQLVAGPLEFLFQNLTPSPLR